MGGAAGRLVGRRRERGGNPAGTLAGLTVGLVLLGRGGGFEVDGPLPRRVLRVLVGGVVLVVLWQGRGALFPGGEDPVALVLRYLRYAAVGAWVGGLGRLLFVRLGLAPPATRSPERGEHLGGHAVPTASGDAPSR